MASSSKDETIVIWNMTKVKSHPHDSVMHVLKDHEHVIDCIKWAPYEACLILDKHSQKQFSGNGNNGISSSTIENGGDQSAHE